MICSETGANPSIANRMLKQSVFSPVRPQRAATRLFRFATQDRYDARGAQAMTRSVASSLQSRVASHRIQFAVPLAQHRSAR
jgi:hypothetical protein